MPRASLFFSLVLSGVIFGGVGHTRAQPAEAPDPVAPAAAKPARAKPVRGKAPPAPRKPPGGDAARDAARDGARDSDKPVDPYLLPPTEQDIAEVAAPARLGIADLGAMQGLLAVQRLDGWLLQDRNGSNPIAARLVAPIYRPQHAWYYLLPVIGDPVLLCHVADAAAFEALAGKKRTYQGYREQQQVLREMLKGKKSVAMEISTGPEQPEAGKLDVGAREVLRALKISVINSDNLVQYTTAVWGQAGRTAHYVAAHHLVELRKEALSYLGKQIAAGASVTEYDLQQRIVRAMAVRGVIGPAPAVAAGINTADPYYLPSAEKSATIRQGDVISLALAMRTDKPDGVFAAQTWMAYVGATVPARVSTLFDAVTLARDQAIALIADRTRTRKPLRGYEVDQRARSVLTKAGLSDRFLHRLGHSIDTSLDGSGADLDDYEVKDTRSLVAGTGVTLGPGVYFAGELGVRSEVSLFLSPSGPEVTTPLQQSVEALLAP